MKELNRAERNLVGLSSAFGMVVVVFPILVASPRYFAGAITLGVLMQVGSAFGEVTRALNWFMDNYPRLADWTSHTVKLADFGLARAGDGQQTGTGLVPGTPYFMAPEQLAGGPPTPQSDFYALGVMLFQLLAGRLPFEGHSMGELLRQAVHEPAPALAPLRPDLPSELTPLVALLLAKRPEHRPADGEALAADLRSIRQAFAPSADLG